MDCCTPLRLSVILFVLLNTTSCSPPLSYFKEAGCNFQLTSEDLNATFIIGGLFPIHERDIQTSSSFVLNVYGVTWVEAFLFAVDEINRNKALLPGVKLGYDIRDTCNNQKVAKLHALDFMSDSKYFPSNNNTVTSIFRSRAKEEEEQGQGQCKCYDGNESKLIGVVGGARSPVSSICSYLLGAGNIPQISYASTSPSLSNTFLYPNLLRTIPSDLQQTLAISELLHFMNWTYVSILASDDTYGQLAIEILQEKFKQKGICLAVEKQFNPNLPPNELDEIAEALEEVYSESKLVIVWATDYNAINKIINACTTKGLKNMLWAIMTETWGTDKFLRGFKDHKVIKLTHDNPVVHNFVYHLGGMKYQSHLDNPWVRSLWQSFGFCPESGPTKSPCYDIVPSGSFLTKTYHETVIASVYAFANGLHNMLNCSKDSCNTPPKAFDYQLFLESTKQTHFRIPSSDFSVEFDENGDLAGSAYYKFILYGAKRVEFGHWNKYEKVHIDLSIFRDNYGDVGNRSTTKLRAACSFPCQPGFYMVKRTKTCCWDCIECPQGEFSSQINSTHCHKCSDIEIPNKQHNGCIPLDNYRSTIESKSGLILCLLSMFGIICGITVLFFFALNWNTPIIKSSNREMSSFQITCIMALFCLPITEFVPLSKTICILQSVMFGSLHSLILALVLLKTYRLWRIFQPLFFAKYMKMFLRVPVQVFSSFLLVFVLMFALTLWYSFHAPDITLYTNENEFGYIYHCGTREPYLLYAFVIYILLLSLASGFIAFRARSLPANFNEAQCIWVAMFANCIAWIALLPLHLSSTKLHQPTIIYSVNFASTFILLISLYGAKIQMLMFSPHLNDKAHFMVSPNASTKTFTLKIKSTEDESEFSSSKNASTSAPERNRVISFNFL